jgi:hypothetical protein
MEPFIDLYSLDVVKKDYSEIADKLLSYNRDPQGAELIGHIFESAFLDIGRQGQWFGEKSELVRSSKYDDIKNGVDMIATVMTPDNNARHLAIASDLTFSFQSSGEKFSRIKNNVWSGKLAEIKYFHSELLHMTGKLSNIPRTVIGLEPENLNRFLISWAREPELVGLLYGSIIMQQIAVQCDAFSRLAHKNNKGSASQAYRKASDMAHILLRTRYKGIESPEDKILGSITKQSERICEEAR